MGDVIRRLVWFAIVATAVAYATLLLGGSIISAQAASIDVPVMVRDEVAAGSHHLSGMLMVPASCDELSVNAATVGDAQYELAFKTWRDPAVPCSSDEVARSFHVVLYAPAAGIQVLATMNGEGLPILLLPVINGTRFEL